MAETRVDARFYRDRTCSVKISCDPRESDPVAARIYACNCLVLRQLINLGRRDSGAIYLAHALADRREPSSIFSPKLVAERAEQSSKRFVGSLFDDQGVISFKLKVDGFGLFSRDISQYAVWSVTLTMKSMSCDEFADAHSILALDRAAQLCGAAWLEGQATPATQLRIAHLATVQGLAEAAELL